MIVEQHSITIVASFASIPIGDVFLWQKSPCLKTGISTAFNFTTNAACGLVSKEQVEHKPNTRLIIE